MVVEDIDRRLLAAIQDGLPLVPRPYTAVGERLGLSEPVLPGRRVEHEQDLGDGRLLLDDAPLEARGWDPFRVRPPGS